MSVPREVLQIAQEVRAAVEQVDKQYHRPMKDFGGGGRLGGWCGCASRFLQLQLAGKGYRSDWVAGYYGRTEHPHCWLEYKGWVIDVTVTQFNRRPPGVYVVTCGPPYKHGRSCLPVTIAPSRRGYCCRYDDDSYELWGPRLLRALRRVQAQGQGAKRAA